MNPIEPTHPAPSSGASPSPQPPAAESPDPALDLIHKALLRGAFPEALPPDTPAYAQISEILLAIQTLQALALSLANGDLSHDFKLRGPVGGSLKSLQASLRHLTWQTQRIADGDFTQHVDFMGEFSNAFNTMVLRLEEDRTLQQDLYNQLSQSEASFRHLFDANPFPLLIVDRSDPLSLSLANSAALAFFDLSPADLEPFALGSYLADPADCPRLLAELDQGSQVRDHPLQFLVGGERKWALANILPINFRQQEQLLVGLADISARVRLEQAERAARTLAEALRDTAAVLNSTLDFNQVLDHILVEAWRVVRYEAAVIYLLQGDQVQIARSQGLHQAEPNSSFPLAVQPDLAHMAETGLPVCVPDTSKTSEVSENFGSLSASLAPPMPDDWMLPAWVRSFIGAPIRARDRITGFVRCESSSPGFYSPADVQRLTAFADQAAIAIENARLFSQTEQMAITDALTGVYNRRFITRLIEQELDRSRRYRTMMSLVMMDIDFFKHINDNYGHQAGDQVLTAVAGLVQRTLRLTDTLGRFGGEEFLLLLPETNLDLAIQAADRVRRKVYAADIETSAGLVNVTVSMGVATYNPAENDDLDAVVRHADQAMYQAKQNGRNQVSYYLSRPK
jgi:diguanylate cyclase (GGDEF)-like protein